jgi:hypothetical protein
MDEGTNALALREEGGSSYHEASERAQSFEANSRGIKRSNPTPLHDILEDVTRLCV